MRTIVITTGLRVLVDDLDYETLASRNWHAYKGKYAARLLYRKRGTNDYYRGKWRMEWDILGRPARGFVIDHIDGNGLNNQRNNLRICTSAQNTANLRKNRTTCASKYKGVSYKKHANRWEAYICSDRKKKHLGYFASELEAANAYNEAAIDIWGEYAKTNQALTPVR